MSQYIAQSIPSGSYQQEYHTIIINTPISGPMLLTASDGESCPPFIEPSFLQSSSPASIILVSFPISIPSSIPSPIDLGHQQELFKRLQDLPITGYLTLMTNSDEQPDPAPRVRLPPIEPVKMDELHNIMNHLDWQHVFTDALNLMENRPILLTTWWHFDHCINTALWLEKEAATQQETAKSLFDRLTHLKVNEVLQPIIVKEWEWGYQEIYRTTNQGPQNSSVWEAPVWQPSETSSSIPPLEFSYPQQSWSTSLTALITTFNSEELFKTAPSTPECPGNPAPPDITT